MKKPNPKSSKPKSFLSTEGPALLVLLFSLFVFFFDWLRFPGKLFLSLDTTDIYYPFYFWVHEHLRAGKLPLISDLSYHGAPMPAVVIVGFLSPVLGLFHLADSYPLAFQLLFIAPWILFLFGAYFLGRQLSLSRAASLLLGFLWTYNGQRLAHLDHLNITWACAFFPWVFWSFLKYRQGRDPFWLLLAGLFWGLNLLTGHPQIVFYQGLLLVFWALFAPSTDGSRLGRWGDAGLLVLLTLWVASPLILHTAECLTFDGFQFEWNELNRYFHSWTPLNLIALVLPWFFGKTQYDRQGMDYWWQYQFTEMQVGFSLVGLFFILLFLFRKGPHRRWIAAAALFGFLMALGRFSPLYRLVQGLPVFSWFRDPARYWFLVSWALGLGAAYSWESWFSAKPPEAPGKKITLGLAFFTGTVLGLGWALLAWGEPLAHRAASWFIQNFLLGDSVHTMDLSHYLSRLPEKLGALGENLNPSRPRVFIPLLLLFALNLAVFFRRRWDLRFQKAFFLALVLLDLMAFRAPLGAAFYAPDIPSPRIPPTQNRILCFLYDTPSPLPSQYGEMAYANVNYFSHIPTLPMEANPQMGRYATLSEKLGWFSWVYKDRDPLGFSHHPNLMRVLGLDLMVSDKPLVLPKAFVTIQKNYPYAYRLAPILPRAHLVDLTKTRVEAWPASIDLFEKPGFDPFREALFDSAPDLSALDLPHRVVTPNPHSSLRPPQIVQWGETRLSLSAETPRPSFLILQKTYLPGWKAKVNGVEIRPLRANLVLTALLLQTGKNQVELFFDPTGLRLGFFLFFLFFATLVFFLLRRLTA